MANLDNYINNLKNILNGECPENNPLKYFTQPKCFFDVNDVKDEIKTLEQENIYSIGIWTKENYNDTNLIYTFVKDLIKNKITIVAINKETKEIENTEIIERDEIKYIEHADINDFTEEDMKLYEEIKKEVELKLLEESEAEQEYDASLDYFIDNDNLEYFCVYCL